MIFVKAILACKDQDYTYTYYHQEYNVTFLLFFSSVFANTNLFCY